MVLLKEYQKEFAETLNVIGLLGAKFVILIPARIACCCKILKVCLNNQNVLFNTFLTIFDWYLCDKYLKSNPNLKLSCHFLVSNIFRQTSLCQSIEKSCISNQTSSRKALKRTTELLNVGGNRTYSGRLHLALLISWKLCRGECLRSVLVRPNKLYQMFPYIHIHRKGINLFLAVEFPDNIEKTHETIVLK